jgi:tetratricopeptide (TPR) repeat protein
VAHYLIHSYDFPPIAQKGLPAARRYAAIAPSAPHALHMPSHIFTRVGAWQDSIDSNRASAIAAKDELSSQGQQALGSYNALHAMDYMVYGYMQLGKDGEARVVVEEIRGISRLDVEHFAAAFAFAAIPARYSLERRQWKDAASLTFHPAELSWDKFPMAESITWFARGIGAARSGDVAEARRDAERLAALRDKMAAAKNAYWAEQSEIQRIAVTAWIARAEGKNEEAVTLMRQAANREDATEKHPVTPGALFPAREMLGDMLIEIGQPAQALREFEASQKADPNRFLGLYGAARAAELSGDTAKARTYYTQLVALGKGADGTRAELQQARTFLAKK